VPARAATSGSAAGYALALGGAAFAGLNGSLARYLLDDGLSVWRLTQMRATFTALVLAVLLFAFDRRRLHLQRADLPAMVPLAVAMTVAQAAYFYATTRMPIAIALLLQYLYPLLLLGWLSIGHKRQLPRGLWGAVLLAFVGVTLAIGGLGDGGVDALGVVAAVTSAVAFAFYIVGSERIGDRHDAVTTMLWTFLVAAVLWALVQPLWTFPTDTFEADSADIAIAAAVVVVGTLIPFGMIVASVRRLPAARASAILTSEAVFGAFFAYVLHDERLAAIQLVGGALVIASLAWLQVQKVDREAERAPRRAAPPDIVATEKV
jgi:drug/metabolite transporter (DMT)-like permease